MARPKANTRWTVLPHAPIERLSERLWRIEGALPATPELRRIVVSHHEVIDRDPARVLRDVAATL